jgi:hypothetical protein
MSCCGSRVRAAETSPHSVATTIANNWGKEVEKTLPPEFAKDLITKTGLLTEHLTECLYDRNQMAKVAKILQWMRQNQLFIAWLGSGNGNKRQFSTCLVKTTGNLISAMTKASMQLDENVFAIEIASQALTFVQLLFGSVVVNKQKLIIEEELAGELTWEEQMQTWASGIETLQRKLSVKTDVPTTELCMYMAIMGSGVSLLHNPKIWKAIGKLGVSVFKSVVFQKPADSLFTDLKSALKVGAQIARRGHSKPIMETVWMMEQIKWHILVDLKIAANEDNWKGVGEKEFVKKTMETCAYLESEVIMHTGQFEVVGSWAKMLADLACAQIETENMVKVRTPDRLCKFLLVGSSEGSGSIKFNGLISLTSFGDVESKNKIERARRVATAANNAVDPMKSLDENLHQYTARAITWLRREAQSFYQTLIGALCCELASNDSPLSQAGFQKHSNAVLGDIELAMENDVILARASNAAKNMVESAQNSFVALQNLADQASALVQSIDKKMEPLLWNIRKFEVRAKRQGQSHLVDQYNKD